MGHETEFSTTFGDQNELSSSQNIMTIEIAVFGILNLYFLVIFSELTFTPVIRFDRFVRILENQRKC
jgi:hypothetical protein